MRNKKEITLKVCELLHTVSLLQKATIEQNILLADAWLDEAHSDLHSIKELIAETKKSR